MPGIVIAAGDFWDITDPKKPFGEFDPHNQMTFPLTVTDVYDKLGSPYDTHEVVLPDVVAPATLPALVVVDEGTYSAGVIPVTMSGNPDAVEGTDYLYGNKYEFTLRLYAADGQHVDKTLRLKFKAQ